jgi:hypothetical protein
VLDVQGFPLMLNWYVVHRRSKRLPPVAQAFKDFLLADGAGLISQIVPFQASAQRAPHLTKAVERTIESSREDRRISSSQHRVFASRNAHRMHRKVCMYCRVFRAVSMHARCARIEAWC